MGRSAPAVTAMEGIETIGDTQQTQVHRTQKAGQPLSGADSPALTEHGSGSSSELTPLASAMSTAKTAMKSARRTTSMVYQAWTGSPKCCGGVVCLFYPRGRPQEGVCDHGFLQQVGRSASRQHVDAAG